MSNVEVYSLQQFCDELEHLLSQDMENEASEKGETCAKKGIVMARFMHS